MMCSQPCCAGLQHLVTCHALSEQHLAFDYSVEMQGSKAPARAWERVAFVFKGSQVLLQQRVHYVVKLLEVIDLAGDTLEKQKHIMVLVYNLQGRANDVPSSARRETSQRRATCGGLFTRRRLVSVVPSSD